jgi:hypothetical protein
MCALAGLVSTLVLRLRRALTSHLSSRLARLRPLLTPRSSASLLTRMPRRGASPGCGMTGGGSVEGGPQVVESSGSPPSSAANKVRQSATLLANKPGVSMELHQHTYTHRVSGAVSRTENTTERETQTREAPSEILTWRTL